MNLIWKYEVHIDRGFKLRIPIGGEVLNVQMQNGDPQMWVKFQAPPGYPKLGPKTQLREFVLAGTGQLFEGESLRYINTFQINSLVMHLFEKV